MIRSNFDDEEGERVVKPEFELQKPPRPMSRQASLMTSTRDLEATGPPDRTYKVVFAVSVLLSISKVESGPSREENLFTFAQLFVYLF